MAHFVYHFCKGAVQPDDLAGKFPLKLGTFDRLTEFFRGIEWRKFQHSPAQFGQAVGVRPYHPVQVMLTGKLRRLFVESRIKTARVKGFHAVKKRDQLFECRQVPAGTPPGVKRMGDVNKSALVEIGRASCRERVLRLV
mgnify:CR=1 FL=1